MSARRPPVWARWLAGLMVRGRLAEFVLGDLEESWARSGGGPRATARFVWWAARSGLHALAESWGSSLGADLRVALRQFRRHPRVHVGGALVLSVGLGIATLMWGVRYGAVGRSLPVSEPDRVLSLTLVDASTRERYHLSLDDVAAMRSSAPSLDAIALWNSDSANLTDHAGPAARVSVYLASSDLFRILEIGPLHGRGLLPSDDLPGSPAVAVLGYRFWRDRYAEDPSVIGRSVRLDGEPVLIVGVLPPGEGLTAHESFWLPMGRTLPRDARDHIAVGRLRSDADATELERELQALAPGLAPPPDGVAGGFAFVTGTFTDSFYGGVDTVRDRVLRAGGLLLLVMALANVANLFLVHAHVRTRELLVRRALGAGRLRILRHLAVEAAVPAVLGGLGAAGVAAWSLAWYQGASNAYGIGFVWQIYRLELPHVLLIAAGALSSTVLVSLVAGTRAWLGGALPTGSLRGAVSRDFRGGRVLLGVEVAVGAALLLLASLMIRSAWNLRSVDFGFTTASVMTADLTLRGPAYQDPESRTAFWDALQAELDRIEGVRESTVGTQLPMIRCCGNRFRLELEGWDARTPDDLPVHYVNAVGTDYFATFERPVLHGRDIATTDRGGTDPVVVVNERLVSRYFPGEIPLGRRLRLWQGDEPGPWRTIVGVAPHLWMDTDVDARPEGMYVPLAQMAPARASMAVRVPGAPETYAGALRAAVARLDPDLPLTDVRSMPQLIRDRTSLYRREGPLFALLGVAALALAVAGLYAVASYLASLRTAELGLRSALGASGSDLAWRSVARAVSPTLLGTAVGLGMGLALTRGFDRFVFLVDPWSPTVAAVTGLALLTCSLAASLPPALRATRLDPAAVLRSE